jgi:hypothetical protein
LGIVGFEMLSGNVPFDADSAVVLLQKHISEPPPPLAPLRPDAPPDLVNLIERTMLKSPNDRFPDMGDFAEAVELLRITAQHAPQGRAELKALAVGETISGLRVVTPMSGPAQVRKEKKKVPLWGILGAAAAVVAAGVGIWQMAISGRDESAPAEETVQSAEPQLLDDTASVGIDSAALVDSVARADSIAAAAAAAAQREPEATPPEEVARPQPPRRATLVLDGIPDQAIIIIDQEVRQDRQIRLSPGEHSVAIQAAGYQAFEETIMLRAGQTRNYRPDLVQMPREFGRLSVFSRPAGTLFIDDVAIDVFPARDIQIAAGVRRIRIQAAGCTPYDTTITVEANTQVNLGMKVLECGGNP